MREETEMTSIDVRTRKNCTLSRAERAWHWRTWNLLDQIRVATDGEDARQKNGEMTTRGLCIAKTSEIRAFERRGWVRDFDIGELFDDNGNSRMLPVWEITIKGRNALHAAKREGIQYL